MRILLVAGFVAASPVAVAEVTRDDFEGETVASMISLCTADEATDAGKYATGFCYGWLEGLEQFYGALLADQRFGVKPVACPGRTLSREETRDAFIDWAQANPFAMDLPALEGLIRAAKESFPCG